MCVNQSQVRMPTSFKMQIHCIHHMVYTTNPHFKRCGNQHKRYKSFSHADAKIRIHYYTIVLIEQKLQHHIA